MAYDECLAASFSQTGLELQESANHVRLKVNVKPRSRENKFVLEPDGTLTIFITAPATKGKANREITRFLAERLNVRTSQVRIIAGLRSNVKTIDISSLSRPEVLGLLAKVPD